MSICTSVSVGRMFSPVRRRIVRPEPQIRPLLDARILRKDLSRSSVAARSSTSYNMYFRDLTPDTKVMLTVSTVF